MFYYPQLTTGSVAQYPASRRDRRRTVTNILGDGSDVRTEDAGAAQIIWDLSYTDLTDLELSNLTQLFEAVEGRLGAFTFLDPLDNLLSWTADLTQDTWRSDPLIQVGGGVQDPMGLTDGVQLTNTAQGAQKIGQTIAVASWFRYCFSAYLRSDVGSTVQMISGSTAGEIRRAISVDSPWRRVLSQVQLATHDDGTYFGFEIPPGCRVTVFGPQVEAQPGAGPYKRSDESAGVYPDSRFDSDTLTITTTGPDQHSCTVRVISSIAAR